MHYDYFVEWGVKQLVYQIMRQEVRIKYQASTYKIYFCDVPELDEALELHKHSFEGHYNDRCQHNLKYNNI